MKTLVLQVDIDAGFIQYNHPNPNIWNQGVIAYNKNNKFIPSVKRWAEKMSYDYRMFYYSDLEFAKRWMNIWLEPYYKSKKVDKVDSSCLNRYAHLDLDYDYILYVDNDILISDDCPEFPFTPGISICPDQPLGNNHGSVMQREYNTNGNTWYSCGVFAVDNKTGIKLKNYVLDCFDNKYLPKTNRTYPGLLDQFYANMFCNNNLNILNELDITWNNIVNLESSIKNPNFAHYAGLNKTVRL